MRSSTGKVKHKTAAGRRSPLSPSESSVSRNWLEAKLDELAIQVVERATRTDSEGLPIAQLQQQLDALKAAGSYWAIAKKFELLHDADDGKEEEGSAWGFLSRQLAAQTEDEDGESNPPARDGRTSAH